MTCGIFSYQQMSADTVSVTAEAAGSSPVVPAISFQTLTEMAPSWRRHKKVPKRHTVFGRTWASSSFNVGPRVVLRFLVYPLGGLALLPGEEKREHGSLRGPLLGSHRLRVGVQSNADRRMAHQFLHDLELRTGRPE